uniref:FtsW/RodA/SpoVE family cell cycle protein n=1 Tax=Agathobacter sp. TaxID=2021311 RepID=UPI004057607A
MPKQYKLKNYHFQLIIYVCALTIIGIMIIGSAKESVQSKQIIGFAIGLVLMMAVSLIDYNFILRFSWLYYFGIIGMLLLVESPLGHSAGGARRWIKLGGFTFQPSELAKIVIVLFFAAFFVKYNENLNTVRTIAASFALVFVPLILILQQPDLSTTIVSGIIFIVLLYIAGLSYKIIVSVLAVLVPVGIILLTYIIQLAQSTETDVPYQIKRILAWLYPEDKRFSSLALQQQNSIMAIGSGQLWGKGLNNSEAASLKNTGYIIEPQTDFIFAVIGEELGFVGTAAVIILLLLIVIECIFIGSRAKDLQGRLICCGMAALVGFQSFVNICVATGLFPNTGIPLPFVSYGLTSIVSIFIGIGFVLNVGLQPKKY